MKCTAGKHRSIEKHLRAQPPKRKNNEYPALDFAEFSDIFTEDGGTLFIAAEVFVFAAAFTVEIIIPAASR